MSGFASLLESDGRLGNRSRHVILGLSIEAFPMSAATVRATASEKKPAWSNTPRYSTTPAYSSDGPLGMAGLPFS